MGVSVESIMKHLKGFKEVSRKAKKLLDQVHLLLPRKFLAPSKNPCWKVKDLYSRINNIDSILIETFRRWHSQKRYSEKEQLLCLPFFFLAGFPKCGTTTAHKMLSLHSSIIPPSTKEPQWWTRLFGWRINGTMKEELILPSFLMYTHVFKSLALTALASQHAKLITYDGSQSTLWDSKFSVDQKDYCVVPAVVSRILPNAKFIVFLRNPATRLYSNFVYSCSNRHGSSVSQWPAHIRENLEVVFHRKINELIQQFNDCMRGASLFECVGLKGKKELQRNMSDCRFYLQRLTIGMYAVHIKKWLQFYPMENFLFVRTEDMSKQSYAIISNVTDFLGISHGGIEKMSDVLLQHENSRPTGVLPMSSRTRLLLETFYQPYNKELALLLNDEQFLWDD